MEELLQQIIFIGLKHSPLCSKRHYVLAGKNSASEKLPDYISVYLKIYITLIKNYHAKVLKRIFNPF